MYHFFFGAFLLFLGSPIPYVLGCNLTSVDACLDTIEPLLDSPLVKGLPHSQEAVQVTCKAFKVGMGCIDPHMKTCLQPAQRKILEQLVAGARHTMAFLCDDPIFQSEFLMHQSCLRGTTDEWEHCAKHFQLYVEEVLSHNISREERNLGLCCAKHEFLRCIYYHSHYKCRKDASLFLVRVAQTLTDVQVHEESCRKIKFEQVCMGNAAAVMALPLTSIAAFGIQLSIQLCSMCLVLVLSLSRTDSIL